jgi:hypothetical protein
LINGVDTQQNKTYRTNTKTEIDDLEYFILNVNQKTQLKNGFRFIKELLIQYHNFKMYSDYNKLVDNNIKIYSVKSDAFAISNDDVERAKSLLNFHNDIGGWRLAKTNNIFASLEFELFENIMVEIPKSTLTRIGSGAIRN